MNTLNSNSGENTNTASMGSSTGPKLSGGNPLQGLYLDLLGCLGGDQNQTAATNSKPKPMTGFSQILNMITDAMADRQNPNIKYRPKNVSRQLGSGSEARIQEIFHRSSASMLNNQSTNGFTDVPQQFRNQSQQPSLYKVPSHTASVPSTITTQRLLIDMSTTTPDENNNFLPGSETLFENANDLNKTPLESFPQELADALKHYDQEGLPKNVQEVEKILLKEISGFSSPPAAVGTPDRKVVRFADPHGHSIDQSPLTIGGGMVAQLLDNFVGLAYHCYPEIQTIGGDCRYCSALVKDDISSTKKSSGSENLLSKNDSSSYHDCCTGEESGDDGYNWSSESGPGTDEETEETEESSTYSTSSLNN